VRYGQEIRIAANPHIHNKPLFLSSCQISPLSFARFTRNQEVCLHTKPTYNTVWRIISGDGKAQKGSPVMATDCIRLEHCATMQALSTDAISYINDFGNECEVSCMNASVPAKTQILAGEYNGEMVREETHKKVGSTNAWCLCMASSPAEAEPIEEAPKYDGAQML
jgi:hypothetical protein